MGAMWGVQTTHFHESLSASTDESRWPVLICILGSFRLLNAGQPIVLRNAIKTKAFLVSLALEESYSASRDTLLQALWPNTDIALAGQSLNSLVHNLRKLLSDKIGGESPIVHADGCYRLNTDAGIGVDADWFKTLASLGEQQERAGNTEGSVAYYRSAVHVYRGDLCSYADTQSMVISESLRAIYMTLLSRLADYSYSTNNLQACLEYAQRLLYLDPCREDAHRVVMRCFICRRERTQAMRQYRLCETILRHEFDTAPEAATQALYNQIRLNPDSLFPSST
jgi:DNA-binding SARP family transcriptional activator